MRADIEWGKLGAIDEKIFLPKCLRYPLVKPTGGVGCTFATVIDENLAGHRPRFYRGPVKSVDFYLTDRLCPLRVFQKAVVPNLTFHFGYVISRADEAVRSIAQALCVAQNARQALLAPSGPSSKPCLACSTVTVRFQPSRRNRLVR